MPLVKRIMSVHRNLLWISISLIVFVHSFPQNQNQDDLSKLISSNPNCDHGSNNRLKRTGTGFPDGARNEDLLASNDDSTTIPIDASSDTNGIMPSTDEILLADDRPPETIPPGRFGYCAEGKYHACCEEQIQWMVPWVYCEFYDAEDNPECDDWVCCAPTSEYAHPPLRIPNEDTCEKTQPFPQIIHNVPDPAPSDIPQSPPAREGKSGQPNTFCRPRVNPLED